MAATPWATIADVKTKTGVDVSEYQRTTAVGVLETVTGLIEEVERPDISDRDRYWLKIATCFQAAFVADHPDLFSRADVTSAAQDGESASFRNVDAHLLAPLARKAIRRLSWRGIRAVLPGGRAARPTVDMASEAFDDSLPWSPV